MYVLLRTNDNKVMAVSNDINKLLDEVSLPYQWWEPDETGKHYVVTARPDLGIDITYLISEVEEL